MKQAIHVIAIALLLILMTGCQGGPTGKVTGEQTIKIGYLGPLTGNTGGIGQAQLNAVRMGVEEINSQGGIDGKQIKLVISDTKHSPKESVSIIRKYIDVDKVTAIIGPTGSSNVMAVAPIVNEAKTPLLGPISTSPVISRAGPYIFRTMPDTAGQTKMLADYAKNNEIKKVSIIYVNNDFGAVTAEKFEENFKEKGGKIIDSEAHNFGETDFKTMITKIMSKDIDGIFLASYPKESGLIVKELKELGFKGTIFGVETLGQKEMTDTAKEDADGVIYATPKKMTTEEFAKRYEERYGEEPRFSADTAYDNLMLIAKAIKRCGTKGEDIRSCLFVIGQDYQGASGKITFDENGDVDKPYSLFRYEGSQRVEMKT